MYICLTNASMRNAPAYLVPSGSSALALLTSLSAVRLHSASFVALWMSTFLKMLSWNHWTSASALLGTSIMLKPSPTCIGYPFILETKYMTVVMSSPFLELAGLLGSSLRTTRTRQRVSLTAEHHPSGYGLPDGLGLLV